MTTVATWNVGDGHDVVKQHGLMRLRKQGADVIGLQECGDRRAMLNEFCRRAGWRAWFGDGSPGAASVPILWDPRAVRAIAFGTREATPATKVGASGAGPSTMKPKVWNRVRFENEYGADLLVLNGHVVPSIYLPQRRKLARDHIAVLVEMLERRELGIEHNDVDIAVVGDFNMRPSHPLTKPLRKAGMVQRTNRPTHGRRTIDHVWTLGCSGSVDVLEMPSDHNAVLFTVKESR